MSARKSSVRQGPARDPEGQQRDAANLCTDEGLTPQRILGLVGRWSLEVTFEETRAHLGVEM